MPNTVHAEACSGHAACTNPDGEDVVSLRDGSAVCGTIVYRDDGRSLIIVSAHQNRTISWADIACITAAGEPPAPSPQEPQTAPTIVPTPVREEEPPARSIALEWDVRLAGVALWKHYTLHGEGAWSWGLGAGLGFGAALHYEIESSDHAIDWYGFELGIAGTVAYASWEELNRGSTSVVEQDLSLRLGARVAPWRGVVFGVAWLPTYVDFYGRHVSSRGAINPAGMRFSVDIGDADGPPVRILMLRIALMFLPYVGRLPSMLGLSAGIVFY